MTKELLAKLTATTLFVIPAYAGIQSFEELPTSMDPRFHGDDDFYKSLKGREFICACPPDSWEVTKKPIFYA